MRVNVSTVTVLVLASVFVLPGPLHAQDKTDEMELYEKVENLVPLLFSKSESIKIKAANKLGKLRASYSVSALAKALKDASVEVRLAVVATLGKIASKRSAKVLTKTAGKDADEKVQLSAVAALKALHIQASYEGCVSVLQNSKKNSVKKAALDCLREWSEPYTPLKKPAALPNGKKEPKPGKLKKIKEKKAKPEKKPEEKKTTIGKIKEIKEPPGYAKKGKETQPKEIMTQYPVDEAYETVKPPIPLKKEELEIPSEEAYVTLQAVKRDVEKCIAIYDVTGEALKVKVLVTPGGRLGHLYILKEVSEEAEQCIKNVITGIEFPPFKSSYVVDHKFMRATTDEEIILSGLIKEEEIFPSRQDKKPEFLPFELNNLGTKPFERAFFSVPHSTGGLAFTLTAEYVVKNIFGFGLELNAGSGTYRDDENAQLREKPVFGNLALFLRLAGAKHYSKVKLMYGTNIFIYTPTATRGTYEGSFYSTAADGKLLAGIYSSQINYYRIERFYPNINRSSRIFIRPDFGLSVGTDTVLMQAEMGFDFMILGAGEYEDSYGHEYNADVENIVMIHLGTGFYYMPFHILQISLEITWIKDMKGKLFMNEDDPHLSERSPEGEFFITPAAMLRLPLGKGRASLSAGFRIPTGEISAAMGNFIWVMGAGYNWQ